MDKLPKREDTDKDATNARRKKQSPAPVKPLIDESDLIQQSLYQGAGVRQIQSEQSGPQSPVKSKAYPAYSKPVVWDPDETASNYSSAYSSKSDSVTPADSFSELSDGSLDGRASRQTSQTSLVSSPAPPTARPLQPDPVFVPSKVKTWGEALGRWTFTGVAQYPQSAQLKNEAKRSQEVRVPMSRVPSDATSQSSENNSSPLTSWGKQKKEVPCPSPASYPLGQFVKKNPSALVGSAGARTPTRKEIPAAKVADTADMLSSPPRVEPEKKQPTAPASPANQTPSPDAQTPRSVVSQESFFNKSPAWATAMKKSEELVRARQGGGTGPKPLAANGSSEEPQDLDQRAKVFGGVRRPATVRRTQSMYVRPGNTS